MDMTLPEKCAANHPTDGAPIIIVRGEFGYHPAPPSLNVNKFNERRNISVKQREAMLIGSMFGWNIPAAHADCDWNI